MRELTELELVEISGGTIFDDWNDLLISIFSMMGDGGTEWPPGYL